MRTLEQILSMFSVLALTGVAWNPLSAADFTQLTTDPGNDRYPDWSHDGAKIAFDSDRSGNREIWVMNADGTEKVNLTDNLALDTSPVWSPDGTRIVFASDRDGDQDIYVTDSDGGNVKRLAAFPGWDAMGDWSLDGTKIVWARGVFEIWVMDRRQPVRFSPLLRRFSSVENGPPGILIPMPFFARIALCESSCESFNDVVSSPQCTAAYHILPAQFC